MDSQIAEIDEDGVKGIMPPGDLDFHLVWATHTSGILDADGAIMADF